MTYQYQMKTKEQLINLLCDLVSIGSITHSTDEKVFPQRVKSHLDKLPYFEQNPTHIHIHETSDKRSYLTALYKHDKAKKTIILLSHFDVVEIIDYGELQHLAFSPLQLTEELHNRKYFLSNTALTDLESNNWLFGRGTMDMKCGLVQHMSLLEKACHENWEINLLLLTVPDEEVNSVGMREAVPKLLHLKSQHHLNYSLMLNSEPMFTQKPNDTNLYFYTGSIGKILAGAYCYGEETHVGEPLAGLNAGFMSSMVTAELEWNEMLIDAAHNEVSPPPTLLYQKDLKNEYSVQIPHRSVSLYNIFLMEKSPEACMNSLKDIVRVAAKKIEKFIETKQQFFSSHPTSKKISVLSYNELKEYAVNKYGEKFVATIENAAESIEGDLRMKAIYITDKLAVKCQELAPMIVLFFAPPYYPPVTSETDKIVRELADKLTAYNGALQKINYYNGISDLSYAKLCSPLSEMSTYTKNVPNKATAYEIPFKDIGELQVPIVNIGPFGRDAHKKTERLHIPFAFDVLPNLLEFVVTTHENQ